MWNRNLMKFRHSFLIKNITRNYAQAATPKVISEDGRSDIDILKAGAITNGFIVENVHNISVFNIIAIQLLHQKTKAKYLHLYRNDNNNVFSINFRTTPKDSTGLPHILEHIVLCGSHLYPVRDPFFKMLNRSLATFMNAMTGSDYTIYPFSTQNYTDYRNLQKIYLDAVFRPKLSHLDFMQEGWRLENENPKDMKSDLIIKGVVYNEMKGAFSENESILTQKLQNLILPDHTYGVVSGGDPLKIPSLTWEDLKHFHKLHYHPSNCSFYSYGNFPVIPTLEYLNSEHLFMYEYQKPDHTLVTPQSRWKEPKSEHIMGRFENMREPFEKQNAICISLVMSDVTDVYTTFLLQFITELMVKGPNSPFYKAMIEPNLSGGFTPCTGFDSQQRDCVFIVGLQGLTKDHFERVTKLYDETIDQIISKGFEQKHIESVLHRYELSIKHESSNFGLSLLFGLTPILNHNGSILDSLKVNELINKLKQELQNDKEYLQKMILKYFKNNKHKLVLTMSPDKDYEINQEHLEKQLISDKTKTISEADRKSIYLKSLELLKEQNSEQKTHLLPTLEMHDVNSDVERTPNTKLRVGPVATQINYVNSNDITYFKGLINTIDLSAEQQMLLPLLCHIITKMGSNKMNYRDFDNYMNLKTAGLHLNPHIGDSLFQLHSYEPGVLLSSYCLDQNIEDMWDLWQQIFTLPQFKNIDRFKMLVQLYMANLTHGLADSGHIYAMQAAGSLVSGTTYQRELLSGLQHISYMKRLVKTSRYDAMLTELSNICSILFDKNKLRCSLNITASNKSKILSSYEKFVEKLPGNTFGKPNEHSFNTSKAWAAAEDIQCQHHVLNVPVYYCSKAILTAPYTSSEHAQLKVLARLLSSKYLHPELREKQGAYGGGARITTDGIFTFYSYRDPHNLKTLDVFDNTVAWLEKALKAVTKQDILEAKLGVFQSVDAPIPPGEKGGHEFLKGLTPDLLQQHRAQIMTVNTSDLQQVTAKLLDTKNKTSIGKVILGPKSSNFDTTKRTGELWTVLDNE